MRGCRVQDPETRGYRGTENRGPSAQRTVRPLSSAEEALGWVRGRWEGGAGGGEVGDIYAKGRGGGGQCYGHEGVRAHGAVVPVGGAQGLRRG